MPGQYDRRGSESRLLKQAKDQDFIPKEQAEILSDSASSCCGILVFVDDGERY